MWSCNVKRGLFTCTWSFVVAHESNMGLKPTLVGELYLVSTEVMVWAFQIPRLTSLHVSLFRSLCLGLFIELLILFRVDKELIVAHTIRHVARWDIDFHHNMMIFASRCENVPVLCVIPKQDNMIFFNADGVKLCKVTCWFLLLTLSCILENSHSLGIHQPPLLWAMALFARMGRCFWVNR